MIKIIAFPLGLIMWLVYQITHNYAWSIVLFTLITKILLFPLSVKMQKSTAAMSAFQPKLEKLKKQYGNNQQKLQEEQMKLYAEEGINPMASCLPSIIQMAILYGVFDVVNRPISHIIRCGQDVISKAVEIITPLYTGENGAVDRNFSYRPETYLIGEIQKNPAAFDSLGDPGFVESVTNFNGKLFGIVDLGDIPTMHPETWDKAAVLLVAIPIMSALVNLVMTIYQQIRSKKMNPDASNMAGMNLMMYSFPLISLWVGFRAPAGLGFYWMLSAAFGLVQSVILYKVYTPEYVAKLVEKDKQKKKKSGRPGLMERYQQIMEEQMAQQNGGRPVTQGGNGGGGGGKIATAAAADEEDEKPEVKLSKAKQKEYERMIIREARRKQAEKYGEEFIEDDEE